MPGLWEAFTDEDDLLRSIYKRWYVTLAVRLEIELETGAGSILDDVRAAYHATAARHPGLRRILADYRDHAAIGQAVPSLAGCGTRCVQQRQRRLRPAVVRWD